MRLVNRDLSVLRELGRWRFVLGRQLRLLCDFASQRTCDRRTKLLIEAGYVERKHILYGVPGLYLLTHKGKILIHASPKPEKIRIEQIVHNIAVVNAALYFLCTEISLQNYIVRNFTSIKYIFSIPISF